MCLQCKPLIKAIDAFLAKEDNDLAEQLTIEGYLEAEASVKTINEIEELVTALLEKNADELLAKLNDAVDLKTLSKRTTDWIKGWSGELSELMKLDTDTQIEAVLESGLKDGKSITEIAMAIADSGIREPGYRARRAALTEVLRAHGYAQLESYTQSPAVEKKGWRHTGSYRNTPRANHVAMDGVVVGVKEPFTLYGEDGGTYYPMTPRDTCLPASESVNCHCILQPIVSSDVLGLPLEERQRLQAEAIAEDDEAWMAELDAKNKAKAGIEEV